MRTHTGERPFTCTFEGCLKKFRTQGHLIDHSKSHSSMKPYPCMLCPKAFMRASTLKVHMRDHTGEKPFRCSKWDKNFKEARSLRAHSKIHENGDSIKIHESPTPEYVTKQPTYKEISSSQWGLSTLTSLDFSCDPVVQRHSPIEYFKNLDEQADCSKVGYNTTYTPEITFCFKTPFEQKQRIPELIGFHPFTHVSNLNSTHLGVGVSEQCAQPKKLERGAHDELKESCQRAHGHLDSLIMEDCF